MNKTELEIYVKRAKQRDTQAIQGLYEYTYPKMYALVYHLCTNKNDVEDILQEGYVSAFTNLDQLVKATAFVSWLKKTIINAWRMYVRDNVPDYDTTVFEVAEDRLEDWQLGSSAQDTAELSETNREIWELIQALPANQRVCMVLYYYDGMKTDEIAETLDIPVGSVKSRLHYGRRHLKTELEQRGLNAAGALQAPSAAGGAAQAGIFAKILTALEAASESSTATVAAKTFGGGLAIKLGVGIVSLLTAGGIIGAAVMKPDGRQSETEAATTTASTTAATVPTTTATTTTTNPPTTTTTTAPQPFVAFDCKTVDGGVAITQYRGSEPHVVIPDSLDGQTVVAIGEKAFQYNDLIDSVTIPSTVRTIGGDAFRECRSLRTVRLGEGVNTVGDSAFLGCNALSEIAIPSGVRRINSYAFAYCTSLTSVDVAEGTTLIDYAAFRNCPNLRSVTLPASVSVIGGDSFDGASPDLTITAPEGTYAYEYAVEKGFFIR